MKKSRFTRLLSLVKRYFLNNLLYDVSDKYPEQLFHACVELCEQ